MSYDESYFCFSSSSKNEWQQKKTSISSSFFYSTEYEILTFQIFGAKLANTLKSSLNFSDGHGVELLDAAV